MNDPTDKRLSVNEIAAELGFGVPAVKRWRGRTIAVLRRAGQLGAEAPTVPLPKNALPIPSNQRDHVRDGVAPRWDRELILTWAERTQRRHPDTKAPMRPMGDGRPPGHPNPSQPRGAGGKFIAAAA